MADLDAQPTKCRDGLCVKRAGRQDFWNDTSAKSRPTNPRPMNQAGRHDQGQRRRPLRRLRAPPRQCQQPANPILADRSADNRGGWVLDRSLNYDKSSRTQA